ncbi:hypothetical protein LSTR_LSTR015622, partial [Laodelphax striatellus]
MAGTNDLHSEEPYQLTLFRGMDHILASRLKTNVVVCSVPHRYDDPSLNENICHSNAYIARSVRSYKGGMKLYYNDVNAYLRRSHFTRHGLHLNRNGKRTLVRQLERFVKHAVGSDCSSSILRGPRMSQTNINSLVTISPVIKPYPVSPIQSQLPKPSDCMDTSIRMLPDQTPFPEIDSSPLLAARKSLRTLVRQLERFVKHAVGSDCSSSILRGPRMSQTNINSLVTISPVIKPYPVSPIQSQLPKPSDCMDTSIR